MIGRVQAHISDPANVYIWVKSYTDPRPWMTLCLPGYDITIHMPGNPAEFARALLDPPAEAAEWAQAPGWGVILVTPGTVIVDCSGIHLTMTPEQAADLGREILRSI